MNKYRTDESPYLKIFTVLKDINLPKAGMSVILGKQNVIKAYWNLS